MTSDQTSGRDRRQNAAAGMAQTGGGLSRKRLLLLVGAGMSGVAAAGCESERPEVDEEGRTDVELLNDALELEYAGVAVYGSEPAERGRDLGVPAREFAEQAAERVAMLTAEVEDRDAVPIERRPDEVYLERVELVAADGENAFIRAAVELEKAGIRGYASSVADLSTPDLRRTFYGLTASSAARISVLLGAAGEPQVPDALVTGQPA
jgi:hypothetical protein